MAVKKKTVRECYRVVAGSEKYKVASKPAVKKLLKTCQTAHVFKGTIIVALHKAGKTTWL
jgi:hypothetical protein